MAKIKKILNKSTELFLLTSIFIVPLAFWLPANEAFELPKSTAFYFFISLSLVTLFIKKSLDEKKEFNFTQFSLPIFIFLIIAFLSMLNGVIINKNAFPLHWQFFKLILFCTILYFLVLNYFSKEKLDKIIFFLLLSHFIVSCYGMLQYFGIDFIKWISFGAGRVYSTMGNPDYMSAQFSILIPLIIMLLISPIKPLNKFFLLLLLIFMFFLIIVAHGRGAWMGFFASLFYLFFMIWLIYGIKFFGKNRYFFLTILCFVLFLIIIFSFPNPINKNAQTIKSRIKSGFDITSDSVAVRLFYWESALHMAKHHPLLGVGIGGFSLNTSFYQRKVLDRWEKVYPPIAKKVEPHVELFTHNDYLQTLSEMGFIGLGIFLWLLFSAFIMPLGKILKDEIFLNKNILLGISGAIVAFAVNALLNFPWRVMQTLVVIYIIFSIFSILEQKKNINIKLSFKPVLIISLLFVFIFIPLQINTFIANICIKNGQKLFMEGKYKEANMLFEKGLASNPRGTDIIELLLYNGNAYNSMGNIDKAIEFYNKGLLMFPNFIEAHYNVGNVYMNNKMFDKAIIEYDKVLELNPKFTGAINNKANIYYNEGNLEKAREMYLKVLEIKPQSVEARYNLGATYFRMGKYKESYEELKKVLEYDPNYSLAKEWIDKMEMLKLVK
ncbi:MAG: tetratricopeptide repeat protein [Candidatus Goldbacteria bacterium]|nr:tetratricopeptide repeat protein [Candidatus Goldiibacteriota bacterium]